MDSSEQEGSVNVNNQDESKESLIATFRNTKANNKFNRSKHIAFQTQITNKNITKKLGVNLAEIKRKKTEQLKNHEVITDSECPPQSSNMSPKFSPRMNRKKGALKKPTTIKLDINKLQYDLCSKFTLSQKSCQNSNTSLNDSMTLSFFRTNIYWSKETLESVKSILLSAMQKGDIKKQVDFNTLKNAILENKNELVLKTLHSEEFKNLYLNGLYLNRDNLFSAEFFIDLMVKNLKFDLLLEVIKDKDFTFDKNYILNFIYKIIIQEKEQSERTNHSIHNEKLISYVSSLGINNSQMEKQKLTSQVIENILFDRDHQIEIMANLIEKGLYPKEEQKVKILAWFFAFFDYSELFHLLIEKNKPFFDSELKLHKNFETRDDIISYGKENSKLQAAICYCLRNDFEMLAIEFLDYATAEFDKIVLVNTAVEGSKMEFLKHLWEKKDFIPNNSNLFLHEVPGKKLQPPSPNVKNIKKKVTINYIIKSLCKNHINKTKKPKEVNDNLTKVLQWKNISKDKTFIDSLFQYNCFEQINFLITICPKDLFVKEQYFRNVIYKKQTELIIFLLHRREVLPALIDQNLQEFIVDNYTSKGDLLYYASEMFAYIYKQHWKLELTEKLCVNLTKTLKTKDVFYCHSPILTCVLFCEFLNKIKKLNVAESKECDDVIEEMIIYSKLLLESNAQVSSINYLMKQKDTQNRTAFQIASENEFYDLFRSPEISLIIKKMWYGKLNCNSLLSASSLHRYIFEYDRKINEPFKLFEPLNLNKVYFFQLSVWLDSCMLRFWPRALNSVLMIVDYNLFIYLLNNEGQIMNNFSELKPMLKILLFIHIFFSSSVFMDFIIHTIFIFKTKRPFIIELWHLIDIFLFLFAWLTILDTKKAANQYSITDLYENTSDFLWNMHLAFIKELHTDYEEFSTSVSFVLRVTILSINDILVWLRMGSILLTFNQMGPVIRMLLSMGYELMKYIVFIVVFLAWSATIFTVLFNQHSSQFNTFSNSVTNLFGGFLNQFKLKDFDDKFFGFGTVLFMIYLLVSGVLLVNMLIAVLSNIYEQMEKEKNASNRTVLVQFNRKYKWNNEYGYLIFLSPPLSSVNFIVLIFEHLLYCHKDKKKFNLFVTKMYYFVFYFPLIVGVFITYSLVLLPISYIKGLIMTIRYQHSLKVNNVYKVLSCFKFIFFGVFFLIYVYFRDVYLCFYYVFREAQFKQSDLEKWKNILTQQDVVIFLKFIHSKINEEAKMNMDSLYFAYINFETNEQAQMNDMLKKKNDYFKTLEKKSKLSSNKFYNLFPIKFVLLNDNQPAFESISRYMCKNLIIMDILNNFSTVDENGTKYVDLSIMRKLLPFTTNVQNTHIRRMIYCNTQYLNQVMMKMNIGKIRFMEYQLVTKIMSTARKLDRNIDTEINKVRLMSIPIEKKVSYFMSSLKEKSKEAGSDNENLGFNEEYDEDHDSLTGLKKKLKNLKEFNNVIGGFLGNIMDIIASSKDSFTNATLMSEISSRISQNASFIGKRESLFFDKRRGKSYDMQSFNGLK